MNEIVDETLDQADSNLVCSSVLTPGLSNQEFSRRWKIAKMFQWKRIRVSKYRVNYYFKLQGCSKKTISNLVGVDGVLVEIDEQLVPMTSKNVKSTVFLANRKSVSVAIKNVLS
jgi:hypothetical protein